MINETVDLYGFYGKNRNTEQGGRLTCWVQQTPASVSPCRKRPAILILPGGGYHHTSEREAEQVALRFAAQGFAAFALHIYREGKHGLSTADAMAYPAYDLPRISWDVPGWLEDCIRFFREVGLTVTDREVHA